MLGLLNFRRTKATPARLLWAVPLLVFSVWGTVKLSIGRWADNVVEVLSEYNDIEYESTFFSLNGDFGVKGLNVVHSNVDGKELATYSVDRVVVHSPGPLWLLRNSWYRTTPNLPDNFSVTLENARNTADSDNTPGNYSNLPYDAIGCGVKLLTPAQFHDMGFASVGRNITLGLHQASASSTVLDFTLETPKIGEMQLKFDLDLARPLKWADTLDRVSMAPVKHVSLSMKDLGFIGPRNVYCAKQSGIAEAAFPAMHRKALADYMRSSGMGFSDEVMDRYSRFATSGGELRLSTNNEAPLLLSKFIDLERSKKFTAFPVQLSLDGGPGTPFAFLSASAVPAVAVPAVAESANATATASGPAAVAMLTSLASSNAAPDARLVAASRVVSFRDLEHLVGAHIRVQTINDTTRTGTLVAYASMMVSMRLDPAEGGFMLAVPVSTVADVSVLGDAPPASTGVFNAQTQ